MEIGRAVEVAKQAAQAGGAAAMAFHKTGVLVERKADDSPVTAADKASEAAIVDVLRGADPGAAILTEESGLLPGSPGRRWIVDPLDGTRGFTRGGGFWGPLVALEVNGDVVAGAMSLPVLGQTYWAGRGQGCFRDGELCRVSTVDTWSEAVLSLGELPGLLNEERAPVVLELLRTAFSARSYGDLMGCALLLDGFADAWLEAGVQVWDLAPLRILVREAGGRFTDFQGVETIESSTAVATNGALHPFLLERLAALFG